MKGKSTGYRRWLWFVVLLLILAAAGVFLWLPGVTLRPANPAVNGGSNAAGLPIKILIEETGVYAVDLDELKRSGIPIDVNHPEGVILANDGQELPFWLDQGSNQLRFYGQAIHQRYTRQNVYLLGRRQDLAVYDSPHVTPSPNPVATSNLLQADLLPSGDLPRHSYWAVQHFEENNLYNPLVTQGDTWLWLMLPAPGKKNLEVTLDRVVPGPGRLRLSVWGSTEAPVSPDHHLIVTVNGQKVADDHWDGKGWRQVDAQLPAGLLQTGKNQIELWAPGMAGVAAEVVYLDSIDLAYASPFQATEDRLDFTSPGGLIQLEGFSGAVDIYDVTDPGHPLQIGRGISPELGFDSQEGHAYWIVGPKGYQEPGAVLLLSTAPDLRSTSIAADYLAIGPDDLLAAVQPLLDRRTQQGITTLAIPVQTVYDQFNQGIPDPQAVRIFLDYARQHWAKAPKYLALIGDATFDPKGYQTLPQANRMPTFFIQTQMSGETASDYGFSLPAAADWQSTDGDQKDQPQLSVGRIPAQTPQQVTDYVNKVIAYETASQVPDASNPWQNKIIAIADGSDPSFAEDAQQFNQRVPQVFQKELLAQKADQQGFNEIIKPVLDQGARMVLYFGHGSMNMWGKDRLFTIQDVNSLENQARLPLLINLTCLTGLFTHPKEQSLAEAFLFKPDGGAVAALAPTSLTLTDDQHFLSDAIADVMTYNANARLGDLLTMVQQQYLSTHAAGQDVLRTFLLFGDPALILAPISGSS